MAKKQTRRSVSIRGTTYDKVREFCERKNVSMSEFVEERIADFFGEATIEKPAPATTRRLPKAPRPVPQATAAKPTPLQAAPKQGNGGDGDRLNFDQLHDAARYFTF